jgi:hypothetical protein
VNDAREALALIPTLRDKIGEDALDRMISDLRQHQEQ